MSLHGAEAAPQRLLPQTMDERLRRWLNKVLGLCLMALAIAGWMAMLMWSERDGVLLRDGGMPLNPMGISAARIADGLLQVLGLAGALALLPIAAAGMRLLGERTSAGWKHRLVVAAASLALVALGLSAIPTPASWPLPYGFGGLLGDTLVTVLAPLTLLLGADSAMQAITVFGIVVGVLGTLRSVDVDPLVLVGLRAEPAPPSARPDPEARARANWRTRSGDPTLELRWPGSQPHRAPAARPAMSSSAPPAPPGAAYAAPPGPFPAGETPLPTPSRPGGEVDARLDRVPDESGGRWPPSPVDGSKRVPDLSAPSRAAAYASPRPAAPVQVRQASVTGPDGSPAEGRPRARYEPVSAPSPFPNSPPTSPNIAPAGQLSSLPSVSTFHDHDATADPNARRIAERFAKKVTPGEASSESGGPSVMVRTHQWLRGLRPRGTNAECKAVRERPRYVPPGVDLLRRAGVAVRSPEFSEAALAETGRLLVSVLSEFGVAGRVARIVPGPVVTRFELQPGEGIKLSRVVGLADDLARALSVPALRVQGTADRATLMIELPNVGRESIAARDLIDAEPFRSGGGTLPLALGKSGSGAPTVIDLARLPNLLIAGSPGSGVAGVVDAAILSLLFKLGPDDCRLLLMAGNQTHARALAAWEGVPHVLAPVVSEPARARAALDWLVREMEDRARRLSAMQVKSIDAYNHRAGAAREKGEPLIRRLPTGFDASGAQVFETETRDASPIPRIVPIIYDPAALFGDDPDIGRVLSHCLGRTARDTGVHVVVGIESASFAEADASTAALLGLFPARAILAVAVKREARTLIGEAGAEHLLGHGDMLLATGNTPIERVHGAQIEREEIAAVAASLANQPTRAPDLGLGAALAVAKLGDAGAPSVHASAPSRRCHSG